MQIVHIANWCTWLAHILCKGLIWNYKNCRAQPWLSFGILQALQWSWGCIRYFFFTDTGFCSEIFKYALFLFLALVDGTFWWKSKHQISLYLGLKKLANILQITFSHGFSFKKITVCLSVCLCLSVSLSVCPAVCLSICLSVCLSTCAFHTFFTMSSSWYHHEIFRSDYQWQKWCLCKSSRLEVKSEGYRDQNPN